MFCKVCSTNNCLRFKEKNGGNRGTAHFYLYVFDILQEMGYNISYMHNCTAFA